MDGIHILLSALPKAIPFVRSYKLLFPMKDISMQMLLLCILKFLMPRELIYTSQITCGTAMRMDFHYPPRFSHPVALDPSIVHAVLTRNTLLLPLHLEQMGRIFLPFHIFHSERFRYNPLKEVFISITINAKGKGYVIAIR